MQADVQDRVAQAALRGSDAMAEATRGGSLAAIDAAERKNEIRAAMQQTGAAYDQAVVTVDKRKGRQPTTIS